MACHRDDVGRPAHARTLLAAMLLTSLVLATYDSEAADSPPRRNAARTLPPAQAPVSRETSDVDAAAPIDAERLFNAIVKVSVRAVADARSYSTLGRDREGTGILIGSDGLVLTIGYLIVEADDVKVTDSRGRTLPAQVVGYDHNSGFGLVRTLLPVEAKPVTLGNSGRVAEQEPVLIASATEERAAFAHVVSKRGFTGSWEYQLESALYTSPPTLNWSGAALIDRDGRLIGIGSLIVRAASEGDPSVPGNLFVPIDLLRPILADLVRQGHRNGPARPWLGVSADEAQGRVVVARVSPDGPADQAGLRSGDIILAVGDHAVTSQSEFYQRLWHGSAGDEVTLKVLQGTDVHQVKVKSIDRLDYFRPMSTI